MSEENEYWFPAKRFGWGWSWPTVWQGKLVVAVFYVLVFAGAFVLLPGQGTTPFVLYVILLTVLLVVVCLIKGEPPHWRSGGK